MIVGKKKKVVFILILVGIAGFICGCAEQPTEEIAEFQPPKMPPFLEEAKQPKEMHPGISLPAPIERIAEYAVNSPLCNCCCSPFLSRSFNSFCSLVCPLDITPCCTPIGSLASKLMSEFLPS
jgi:hypothetical protein